jgi:hypothetical protein
MMSTSLETAYLHERMFRVIPGLGVQIRHETSLKKKNVSLLVPK